MLVGLQAKETELLGIQQQLSTSQERVTELEAQQNLAVAAALQQLQVCFTAPVTSFVFLLTPSLWLVLNVLALLQGKQAEVEQLQQQLQAAQGSTADINAQVERADIEFAEKLQVN